jgi:uncharacterized membrane protein/predicted DsbA family dithiol-disulfide isomerase
MIWAAFTSALISVGIHSYLTIQHFQLKLGMSAEPSFCHVNATFNCDAVAVSSPSVLFGMPLALWGAWTNLILAILLFISALNLAQDRQRVLRYATWLALFIASTSIVMGLISSMVLKTYCLYCIVAYVFSFATLVATRMSNQENLFKFFSIDIKESLTSHRWVLICLALIPLGAWISQGMIFQNYGLDKLNIYVEESIANWHSAPVNNFQNETGLILNRGGKEPVMTIVEFADFLCPHCKMAYPSVDAFASTREGVRLIFKPFPLDGVCNKDIEHKGDGVRCLLAEAVLCADKEFKRGWDMHHLIFDNQESFASGNAEATLKTLSIKIGLDFDAILKCTQSDETKDLLEKMAHEGAIAKIQGTPAIFVNGKLLERGQLVPVLEGVRNSL